MKGILQYATADAGVYKNFGTLRTKDGQLMNVTPETKKDRSDNPALIAFNVELEAQALTVNSDFLDNSEWYFRVIFLAELQEIRLGLRPYFPEFDAALQQNGINFNRVKLEFKIGADEFEAYTTPVALPPEEGGVIVEDSGILVE